LDIGAGGSGGEDLRVIVEGLGTGGTGLGTGLGAGLGDGFMGARIARGGGI